MDAAKRRLPRGLTREQIGWLGEHDLDRAILLGSGGRLQPYLPLYDTRRVDRIYAWDGIEASCFLQAKATGHPRTDGRYSWNVPAVHFTPYRRFAVALAIMDLASGRLSDPAWIVPSRVLARVASRGNNPALGGPVYELTASTTGHDRLAPYRCELSRVWTKLVRTAKPSMPRRPRFPALHEEQGAFYECAHIAEELREGQDDLLLFRSANDIAGRDLLVQLVDTPRTLFLQIKGTARLAERDSVHMLVRRRTFRPQTNFWLAFYYYDRARGALFEDCWLVPSVAFARRTAPQRDATTLSFETQLTRTHDRWGEFRHPVQAQSEVLRRALHALPDNG
jgi:hypothetical protein